MSDKTGWRLACSIALFAALGFHLPTSGTAFALALFLAMIWTGRIVTGWRPWIGAVGLVSLGILMSLTILAPKIEEGHNRLALWTETAPQRQAFAPETIDAMQALMRADWPELASCATDDTRCRTATRDTEAAFAPSADALVLGPAASMSRRARDIDFDTLAELRPGFLNDKRWNEFSTNSYIDRTRMPYFVAYALPDSAIGGRLCWRGHLVVEQADGSARYEAAGDAGRCLPVDAALVDTLVIGIDTGRGTVLGMRLHAPISSWLSGVAAQALPLALAITVLLLLARPVIRRALGPMLLIGLGAATIAISTPALWAGTVLHFGGGDGLTHEGFGRAIAFALKDGDWSRALMGEEAVFYFMPGLRYLRALEAWVAGESDALMVLALLAWPVLVFALVRQFLPLSVAIWASVLFTATSVFKYTGFAFVKYVEEAALGHPEPLGYLAFLAGVTAAVSLYRGSPTVRARHLAWLGAGLLFALAVFLRPNTAVGVAAFCGTIGLVMLARGRIFELLAWALGVSASLIMLAHNIAFGGEWVLFTAAVGIPANLQMPPATYLQALSDVLSGNGVSEAVAAVLDHLDKWFGPFRLLVFLAAVAVAFGPKRVPVEMRAIALAALAQQALLFFYHPNGRYEFLAWFLTMLVAAWLLRDRLGKRIARGIQRLARLRASRHLSLGLGLGGLARRRVLAGALEGPTDAMPPLAGFKTWARPFASPLAEILARIPARRGPLMDIGTGHAALPWLALRIRGSVPVIGSDVSDAAFATIRQVYPWTEPPRLIAVAPDTMPSEVRQATTVCLADVLHHVSPGEQRRFLIALAGAMRPDATLVLSDIDAGRPVRRWLNQLHDLVLARQWVHPRDMAFTISALREAGLDIVETRQVRSLWYGHYLIVARRGAGANQAG